MKYLLIIILLYYFDPRFISTTEYMPNLCVLYKRYSKKYVFLDFKKLFDCVWHDTLWATMKGYNMDQILLINTMKTPTTQSSKGGLFVTGSIHLLRSVKVSSFFNAQRLPWYNQH